jgi:hypothetical protein
MYNIPMALRSNSIGNSIFNSPSSPTGSLNARFTQAQSFGTPAAQIYSRASLNPGAAGSNVVNMMPVSTIRFNGRPDTNPSLQAGNFLNGVYYNIADNSLTNGYNLARGGLNYDIRGARGGLLNAFAPVLNRPVYPNGQPYLYPTSQDIRGTLPGFPNGYAPPYDIRRYENGVRIPYNYPYAYSNFASPYSYPNDWPYATSYANPYYDYPLTAPECNSYLGCANYQNPNDCRSCVSTRRGPSHCADQICGPAIL